VSPRQKALLVGLVRRNVKPEPITLAIGDGANDVGMIQEAHVGVGISGKEGKQAVNASDFAIAQFRFLETLILIHGRWDFFRLASVTMFSFYKNAVMAGTIIIFTDQALYSGTPLYDEWVLAMLNFVAAWPIIFTGLFDRVLSKEYVRKNPEVYRATRENELITYRTLLRWIILVFIHVFMLYNFTVPQQAYGGGVSPAFNGLMRFHAEEESPGDGEGGDLKSVGTVTFTCLIFLLAYKVRILTRSSVRFSRLPLLILSHLLQGLVRNSVTYPRSLASIHVSQRCR
jgi:phospholipid-translocating ATPase/phospholipid-transporting ATPase